MLILASVQIWLHLGPDPDRSPPIEYPCPKSILRQFCFADTPAPTAINEIAMLKIKLEAEIERVHFKEEMIEVLKKDKVYLQEELAKKDAYVMGSLCKLKSVQ